MFVYKVPLLGKLEMNFEYPVFLNKNLTVFKRMRGCVDKVGPSLK
jgi:hypothetical protein